MQPVSRSSGRSLGMQGSQQGQGNGLDLGEAEVAGEVKSEWAARGKEMGVGGAARPAGPRGLSTSPQA